MLQIQYKKAAESSFVVYIKLSRLLNLAIILKHTNKPRWKYIVKQSKNKAAKKPFRHNINPQITLGTEAPKVHNLA